MHYITSWIFFPRNNLWNMHCDKKKIEYFRMCIVCMREGKEIEYFGIIYFFVFSFIHFLPTNIDMFFYKLNDKIKCNKIIRHAQALHHVHGFSKKYPSVKTILVSQPNLRHPTNLCQYQFSCCNVRTILYPHHR